VTVSLTKIAVIMGKGENVEVYHRCSRSMFLPAYRRLLFPLLHTEKEIGDVCTQAIYVREEENLKLTSEHEA